MGSDSVLCISGQDPTVSKLDSSTAWTSQLAEEEWPLQGLTAAQGSSWGRQELAMAKWRHDQQGWDEEELGFRPRLGTVGSAPIHNPTSSARDTHTGTSCSCC